MTIARLREREVENKLVISEGEIDNYLSGEMAEASSSEEYEVAHILLRAPESASPEQIQRLKSKVDQIHARLLGGEDFNQTAAAYSDAPDALQGGSLGVRPLDRLPAIFSEVAAASIRGRDCPCAAQSERFSHRQAGRQAGRLGRCHRYNRRMRDIS